MICGPTAAGKSSIALRLAERHRLAIVSADSRQIYRRFDIGTAKPSPAEREAVPHEGIDVADPTERYSASRWAAAAGEWIARSRAAGREPVLVGGTGFYLRALFAPLFQEPELDDNRRAALAAYLGELPLEELRRWCAALDPARVHMGRVQLLRAIEIALLSGHRLSDLHVARARPPRFAARYLLVDPGPALGTRIAGRVRAMLAHGWEAEVRALAACVPADAPAWNATGYRTIRLLAEGAIDAEEAVHRVTIETRQYAKRQRTWFRHQLTGANVTRLDPGAPLAMAAVESWWEEAA